MFRLSRFDANSIAEAEGNFTEAKLDELRSYLYANRESVRG
jgi:hypothetical protein